MAGWMAGEAGRKAEGGVGRKAEGGVAREEGGEVLVGSGDRSSWQ